MRIHKFFRAIGFAELKVRLFSEIGIKKTFRVNSYIVPNN